MKVRTNILSKLSFLAKPFITLPHFIIVKLNMVTNVPLKEHRKTDTNDKLIYLVLSTVQAFTVETP